VNALELANASKMEENMSGSSSGVAQERGTRSGLSREAVSMMRARAGATIALGGGVALRCPQCRASWGPCRIINGRMPERWWQCPNGCDMSSDGTSDVVEAGVNLG